MLYVVGVVNLVTFLAWKVRFLEYYGVWSSCGCKEFIVMKPPHEAINIAQECDPQTRIFTNGSKTEMYTGCPPWHYTMWTICCSNPLSFGLKTSFLSITNSYVVSWQLYRFAVPTISQRFIYTEILGVFFGVWVPHKPAVETFWRTTTHKKFST